MGKIRETFRLVGEERGSRLGAPGAALVVESTPTYDSLEPDEMPYIEIGPRREIEASPEVMACPVPRKPTAARVPGVTFRNLPRTVPGDGKGRVAAELVAYHTPQDAASRAYGDLLESMLDAVEQRIGPDRSVFLLTALRPGIGSTTVLLNLAITAARQEKQVLVVDANLRRPAVAERLGMEVPPGLTEVLSGEVPLQTAVRATVQQHLKILSSGSPAALWADPESLRELLNEVKREADLVLVDGPCWDGRSAVLALAQASDALFLISPRSEADVPPTSELVNTLPAQAIRLAGCILTGE